MTELAVTHTSIVTSDQIDHLGHMNVRYYASNARRGTRSLLEAVGAPRPGELMITDMYTRHHREQLEGAALEVRSGVLGVVDDSIRIYHELVNAESDEVAATFVHRTPLDRSIDPEIGLVDLPPHGSPRSIDLAADPIGSAPTLETVRELGLEMRKARVLGDLDCEESNHVVPHMITHLVWGGEPPNGGEQELRHVGPDGENMGWATMETRVGVARRPERGCRIQSFATTTAIANKTTQMVMWVYDLDRADLLVTFEVVNLAFNIDARRSMPIPPEMRAREEARLHAELAPR